MSITRTDSTTRKHFHCRACGLFLHLYHDSPEPRECPHCAGAEAIFSPVDCEPMSEDDLDQLAADDLTESVREALRTATPTAITSALALVERLGAPLPRITETLVLLANLGLAHHIGHGWRSGRSRRSLQRERARTSQATTTTIKAKAKGKARKKPRTATAAQA